jgi:glycerophosphoryl diester phosphodiesterase
MDAAPNPFLRPQAGTFMRVGHRGAAALAPANSLEGIEAALALGVEMVEVDVVLHGDRLVLAHERRVSAEASPPALTEALELITALAPRTYVQVDVKWPGPEAEVIRVLRTSGLGAQALVSTSFRRSLQKLQRLAPDVHVALSYPADRYRLSRFRRFRPGVSAALGALRVALPFRLERMLDGTAPSVVMLNYLVVSKRTVDLVHRRGTAVFAWTVNDARTIRRVAAAGVDGIVTDNPRLLAATLKT